MSDNYTSVKPKNVPSASFHPADNSFEDDFELACSDEELSMKDGVEWEPNPVEIVELFETLDKQKILPIDWECPERRPLTPEGPEQRMMDDGYLEEEEEKSGFDFEDESSPMKIPVRPVGSEARGSAKKKTPTNLDDILSNMARHRKLDMMDDDDDALLL